MLDHGSIVQSGRHDELLVQAGLYREIYDLQLRDQEEFLAQQSADIHTGTYGKSENGEPRDVPAQVTV
ncbi:MAG: hypothetical protein R2867_45855 [Caldilineaceae bacterium]